MFSGRTDVGHEGSVAAENASAPECPAPVVTNHSELRERELRYRFLADAMPQIVWTSAANGDVDYFNQRWYDYTGLTFAQTKDWAWQPVLHPDDLQPCLDRWTHSVSTGENYEVEYRLRNAEGKYRWHLGRAFPMRDEAGAIVEWVGTCTDIDDYIRAKAELKAFNETLEEQVAERTRAAHERAQALIQSQIRLRESEERFRGAFDFAAVGMGLLSLQGDWTKVNTTLCEMLHRSEEALLKSNLYDLAAERDRTVIDSCFEELIEGTAIHRQFELRFKGGEGAHGWLIVSLSLAHDSWKNPLYFVGQFQEITHRKLTESQLLQKSMALENAMEGIAFLDEAGRYLSVNPAYASMSGSTVEGMAGQRWDLPVHGDDVDKVTTALKHMLVHGKAEVECRGKRADGSPHYIQVTMVSAKDEQGRIIGHYSFMKDITSRKLADENLKRSLKEKEVLLKEVHHRVKNNLQIVSGLLQLQSDRISDPRILEVFKESQNRVNSMTLIHENLYQSEDISFVNLENYMMNLCRSVFHSFGVTGNRVIFELNVENVPLDINTVVPCGLIVNELVSNSLKYAFPGETSGKVFIEFRSLFDKNYLLRVGDTGVGLPKAFRLDTAKTLGLKVVHTLTEQLQGEIELDSTSGVVFDIKFRED